MLLFLRLDIYFFLAYSIQYATLVLKAFDYQFYLTLAMIPFLLIMMTISAVSLERENRAVIGTLIGICLASIAYFILKIVQFNQQKLDSVYLPTRKYLTFFGLIF